MRVAAAACGSDAGRVVQLVKNFRSHAEILDYVAAIFDGTPQGRGGLMQGFLNLQAHDGRKDGMVARVAQSPHSRGSVTSLMPASVARRSRSSGLSLNRKLFTAAVTSPSSIR